MTYIDEKLVANHFVINISNNLPLINLFNQYIKLHPEFYKLNINYRLIIAETDAADTTPLESRPVYTIYDEPVQFADTIHNTAGWIVTDYVVETLQNGKVRCDYTFKIWIKRVIDVDSNRQYHVQVQEYMQKQARHGDRVTLNYYKILNEQLITHTFYDRKLSNWIGDIRQLKDEFFSPHKKYLFDVMTKVNRNGNWSNLILHGEPGTGKSSFVYRLATRLKMSIISVDLSMYIDRKRDLYSIFHGNEFNLPYGKGQKLTVSQNCIIILEEFDSAIEKIKQLENIFVFKSDTIHTYVENKTSEIGQKVQTASAPTATTLQMDVPLSDPFQYIASKQNSNGTESIDPLKITNEIFDIVRTITEDNKSDVLRLRDMLELFQGPVPVKDRIIVATTNNYEQIKNIIPALFRPGRLTPIKFTYLEPASFCELCQYYFGIKPHAAQIPAICIPTSQITELAIKYTSITEGKTKNEPDVAFADFIQELVEINNAAKQSDQAPLHEQPSPQKISANEPNGEFSYSGVTSKNILKQSGNIQSLNGEPQLPQSTPTSGSNCGAKVDMYSNWIDKKLGMIREETTYLQESNIDSDSTKVADSKQSVGEFPPPDALTKKKPKKRQERNYVISSNTPAIASRMPDKPKSHYSQSVGTSFTQASHALQYSEDDQIRNTVVEKVLANEKSLRKKNPYYNPEELIHNYMQTAIVAPQHDDEY